MEEITKALHEISLLEGASRPTCIYFQEMGGEPTYSIVIPIHNQENIIVDNIQSVLDHTGGTYELILILDSCVDNTENVLLHYLYKTKIDCHIVVIKSTTPLFETSCDNLGFKIARGKYLLEIQADMRMTEKDYNITLTKPFLKYDNVIGVSGRCAHDFAMTNGVGKLGMLIEKPYDPRYTNTLFYVNETCNRGPLLFDRLKMKQLDYLDEENFYLDNSDHDLFARAYAKYKYICGYVPIEFASPLSDGSTRKPRDALNSEFLAKRAKKSNGGFLKQYRNNYVPVAPYVLPL